MDIKDFRGLMEAYSEVYAPQEQLDEAITSEKGKAKAAEMIAKRTTASGRAKPGQGANVATIKHIGRSNRDGLLGTPPNRKVAGSNWPKSYSGIGGTGNKAARRAAALKNEELDIFDVVLEFLQVEGFAETLEQAEWMMANMIDGEAIDIILDEEQLDEIFGMGRRKAPTASQLANSDYMKKKNAEADAQAIANLKGMFSKDPEERKRTAHRMSRSPDAEVRKEEYVDEAQHARENPEKYEREQAKKSAPVRGERTPMPPRGDKRREDFEKWYAKQMGR